MLRLTFKDTDKLAKLLLLNLFFAFAYRMYWGLGIIKIIYGYLTFRKLKLNWRNFWIFVVAFTLLLVYFVSHRSVGDYNFKSIFFVGTIVLMTRVIELFNADRNKFTIDKGALLYLLLIIIVLFNFIFIKISGKISFNNEIAAESERLRGYFPYFLVTIYLVQIEKTNNFFLGLLLFSVVAYLLEGTRGSVAVFLITTIAIRYMSVKLYFICTVLQVLIYPVIVVSIVYIFPSLSGQQDTSFAVKSSGFVYLLRNLTINGTGILPPTTFWISPAERFGFHFIPADYGFLGAIFELGFFLPVFRIGCLAWVCMNIPNGFDIRYKNIIIYFLFSIAGSYGMANDYAVLVTNFIILIILTGQRSLHRCNIVL